MESPAGKAPDPPPADPCAPIRPDGRHHVVCGGEVREGGGPLPLTDTPGRPVPLAILSRASFLASIILYTPKHGDGTLIIDRTGRPTAHRFRANEQSEDFVQRIQGGRTEHNKHTFGDIGQGGGHAPVTAGAPGVPPEAERRGSDPGAGGAAGP